jgi:hypothetical protein
LAELLLLFGALAPFAAALGEYSFGLGNVTGTNYLQILREDSGGGTDWSILVESGAPGGQVPEPHGVLVLCGGLLALRVLARRREKA